MKTSKRSLLAIGTFAALLPFGVAGVEAAGITSPAQSAATGFATPLDRAIDVAIESKVAAERLSPAEARTAREQLQLQFLSLSKAAQQSLVDRLARVAGNETVADVGQALSAAVEADARQALADVQGKVAGSLVQGMQPKLGVGGGDLVFVATAGPCRVADTRLNINADWPGPVAGFTGRQIWAFSWFGGYNFNSEQGGTGVAGSGNCVGTVFPTTYPTAVVATVAVVNTSSTGYLRAWNGGTTLTVGGILGWNAGDVLSNTTVIPLDRSIVAYPGSGPFKRDFAVYNNSGNPVDVIVDVVGYFIENAATPLNCTTVTSTPFAIAANSNLSGAAPACTAGYSRVSTSCFPANYTVYQVGISGSTCYFHNSAGSASSFTASSLCCQIPGR